MRIVTPWALAATLLLAAGPAIAELPSVNSIGGKSAPKTAPKVLPPPALPGAAQNAGRVTPSFRPPTDMEPTDALFDAINRGDISAARDAISRGAELNGHNILGMTPMELSIDLGRNDISFLLLSMRGTEDGRGGQSTAAAAGAKPASTKPAARSPVVPAKTRALPVQPQAAQQTAKLFSGDGGAPIPDAGFLGFDTSRR
jgi:hypothetical protein